MFVFKTGRLMGVCGGADEGDRRIMVTWNPILYNLPAVLLMRARWYGRIS